MAVSEWQIASDGIATCSNHLESRQMFDERANVYPSRIFGYFVLVAHVPDNIVEVQRARVLYKLPNRCACPVQAVIVEGFYIQDHARAVVQGRENGRRRFLDLHHKKDKTQRVANASPVEKVRASTLQIGRKRKRYVLLQGDSQVG
jgi:hypothetical protein